MLLLVAAFGSFLPCKGMLFLTEQGKKLPEAAGRKNEKRYNLQLQFKSREWQQ
jgi:hypothetical protein